MPSPIPLPIEEIEFTAIRAQGAGGQNVNKVSNAVHLRFDIANSSLPESLRMRLLALDDRRISKDGVLVIKAQEFRSLEKNRAEALRRLEMLVAAASVEAKPRRPTKPTRSSLRRRQEAKQRHSALKSSRRGGAGD